MGTAASSNGVARLNVVLGVLAAAFGIWAGVVGFSAKMIMERIDKISTRVEAGILPVAEIRVRRLEQECGALETEIRKLERRIDRLDDE